MLSRATPFLSGPGMLIVCSVTKSWLSATPWTAACHYSLSFTICWSSLKLMAIEFVMPSKHLIFCHSLLPLPSVFPSIRVFSNESVLHIRWPKYWSFSFSISPSNEYAGLISFRIDWFDLFAGQGTQESSLALQFESINSLALSLFTVQLSHLYMTTGKTITLTRNPRRQHSSALNHTGPGAWDHSYGLKPPKVFKLAYPKLFTCPASPFSRSSSKGSGLNLPLALVFLITLASSSGGPMWDSVSPVSRILESNKLCFSQPLFLSLLVATPE